MNLHSWIPLREALRKRSKSVGAEVTIEIREKEGRDGEGTSWFLSGVPRIEITTPAEPKKKRIMSMNATHNHGMGEDDVKMKIKSGGFRERIEKNKL